MKIAEAEEEEIKRKEIQSVKQVRERVCEHVFVHL